MIFATKYTEQEIAIDDNPGEEIENGCQLSIAESASQTKTENKKVKGDSKDLPGKQRAGADKIKKEKKVRGKEGYPKIIPWRCMSFCPFIILGWLS